MAIVKLFLHGGGEHARVVLECIEDYRSVVEGIFDPKLSGSLDGIPFLGKYDPKALPHALGVIAIGDNSIRQKIADTSSHKFANAISSSAIVSPSATLGHGVMILHGAIVQAHASIGNHVIMNTGAQADHDCKISDYAHIGPGAILCGKVTIGEGAFVGAGAIIIPGVQVGAWSVIGAGSVVLRNVAEREKVVGNPARSIGIPE